MRKPFGSTFEIMVISLSSILFKWNYRVFSLNFAEVVTI
ncbi:hypothetical protein VDG1235_3354 [Verrucomicrobiia bacterium DG1235]|nr:hypothetical protein VDG1235_3354 [Verrucomicrobiae bacterium DG1235]